MGETDKDRQKKIILVLLFLLLLGGLFYFFLNQDEAPTSAQLPRPNLGEVTQAQPDAGADTVNPETTAMTGAPTPPPPPTELPAQDMLTPPPIEAATPEAPIEAPPAPAELPTPKETIADAAPVAPPPPIVAKSSTAKPPRPSRRTSPKPRPEKSLISETPPPMTTALAESWKPAPSAPTDSSDDSEDSDASESDEADGADLSESETEAAGVDAQELVPKPIAEAEGGLEKTSEGTDGTAEELEQSELSNGSGDDSLDAATDAQVEEDQARAETESLLAQNEGRVEEDKPVETQETIDEGGRTKLLMAENEVVAENDDGSPDDSEESESADSAAAEAASAAQEDWVGDFHADTIHLIPVLQIGQLSALPSFTTVTDTVNASANFGVGFDWNRRWSKRIQTEVHLQYLSYTYTAGSRTLTGETGGLFGGGLAASYFVKKGFDVSLRLRFSQELFYRATTVTAANLDQALIVFPGIGAGYSIHLSNKDLIRIWGSVDLGLPNRLNGYTINTFMNYQIRAGYETDAPGFHLGGDLGFRMDDVSTSIGTQVWTGFEGRLKAGVSF